GRRGGDLRLPLGLLLLPAGGGAHLLGGSRGALGPLVHLPPRVGGGPLVGPRAAPGGAGPVRVAGAHPRPGPLLPPRPLRRGVPASSTTTTARGGRPTGRCGCGSRCSSRCSRRAWCSRISGTR